MRCEDDPNIIYGGDVSNEENPNIYKTFGQALLSNFKLGGDRPAFVGSTR
jgi:hypothetical protein